MRKQGNQRGEAGALSLDQSLAEKSQAAIAVFEKYHGPLHPNDLAKREMLENLVKTEGSRFDLKLFQVETRRIAAKDAKFRGRLDLVITDYKQAGGSSAAGNRSGPAGLTPEQLAAYQRLNEESRQATDESAKLFDQIGPLRPAPDSEIKQLARRLRRDH